MNYEYIPQGYVIFDLGKLGKRIFHGDVVDEWFQAYTTGDLTIDGLARMFDQDKADMKAMLSALGLTKNSAPRAPWKIQENLERLDELVLETMDSAVLKRIFEEKRQQLIESEYNKLKSKERRKENFYRMVGMYSDEIPYEPPQPNYVGDVVINLVSVLSV